MPDQQPLPNSAYQPSEFNHVREREYAEILKRRKKQSAKGVRYGSGADGEATRTGATGAPADLFGIALSGGGIRSASFCLGALQALDRYKLIDRSDYLSTVSGGGYVGAGMVAAMNGEGRPFPFAVASGGSQDIRDSEAVKDIRDHSRFLAPNGSTDILRSVAILLRGLAVNLILLLGVLFALAVLVVMTNPTTDNLTRSFIFDACVYWLPGWLKTSSLGYAVAPFIRSPFFLTHASGIALLCYLTCWALRRSYVDGFEPDKAKSFSEPRDVWARIGGCLFLGFVLALLIEIQPIVVSGLIGILQGNGSGETGLKALWAAAAAVVTATAAFRGTLVTWLEKALNAPTFGSRVQAAMAKMAFYALGLALPILIYGLFLMLVLWGIKVESATSPAGYAFGPLGTAAQSPTFAFAVLAGLFAFSVGRSLVIQIWHPTAQDTPSAIVTVFKGLWAEKRRRWLIYAAAAWLILLALATIATRGENGGSFAAADPKALAHPDEWFMLANLIAIWALLLLVGVNFTENANGLHRLYRDRLCAAFKLNGAGGDDKPLQLHELTTDAPYLLINGTLNVRRSSYDDDTVLAPTNRRFDPVRRGRNAEFFLFSKLFVGSDATGFVNSERLARSERQLDLATAAAISGAAVSSSMGRLAIGLLGPTLALLNLRLGFWLTNPQYLSKREAADQNRQQKGAKDSREWYDIMRLYLFAEAFGIMRADSSRIYITDGGHIDNLGLYQLLKRRCKLIIVVDAEADPGFNFGAFCDVQRFARIDEGVRITLDWKPVRAAALERQANPGKPVPADSELHKCHFAIGSIDYEEDTGNKESGIILYVKASVTGDEKDYVLDYERRFPQFPHESTGDQFFSEEQMEAYRALGFHAMRSALEERQPGDVTQPRITVKQKGSVDEAIDVLKPKTVISFSDVTTAQSAVERDGMVSSLKMRLGVPGLSIDKPKH